MSNSWDNVLLQLTSKLNTVARDYNLPITCFVEGDNIKIFDYSKLKKNSKLYNKTEAYKKNIEDFYNDFIDFCQVLNEEV